jgi:hypothetical protein
VPPAAKRKAAPGGRTTPEKPLLDKLGVKPAARVTLSARRDENFLRQLRKRTSQISVGRAKCGSELIFLTAERKADLQCIRPLRRFLEKAGAFWVVYPKAQARITQADVMAAAKAFGLVDVKVVRFSSTHTALKLVIPLARR